MFDKRRTLFLTTAVLAHACSLVVSGLQLETIYNCFDQFGLRVKALKGIGLSGIDWPFIYDTFVALTGWWPSDSTISLHLRLLGFLALAASAWLLPKTWLRSRDQPTDVEALHSSAWNYLPTLCSGGVVFPFVRLLAAYYSEEYSLVEQRQDLLGIGFTSGIICYISFWLYMYLTMWSFVYKLSQKPRRSISTQTDAPPKPLSYVFIN